MPLNVEDVVPTTEKAGPQPFAGASSIMSVHPRFIIPETSAVLLSAVESLTRGPGPTRQ